MPSDPTQPGTDDRPDPAEAHPARDALDRLFRSDPHARSLGIELVDWGLGWAEVRATPTADHGNFLGTVHGGLVFSLADVALSYAGNSWGRMSLALSMEVQYLKAATVGTPLYAVARCRSRSRRISSFGIDVTDPDGTLTASFQALNYRVDRWHLDADAWPTDWQARH